MNMMLIIMIMIMTTTTMQEEEEEEMMQRTCDFHRKLNYSTGLDCLFFLRKPELVSVSKMSS
jgi:hypothetical protein